MGWPPAFQTYYKTSSDYGWFLLVSYFIEENMYQMPAESPADEKIYYVYNIVLLVGVSRIVLWLYYQTVSIRLRAVTFKWYVKEPSCVLTTEHYFFKKED